MDRKKCSKCRVTRSILEFWRDANQGSGYKPSCKFCQRSYKQQLGRRAKPKVLESKCCRCLEVKPSSAFYKTSYSPSGLFYSCKDCEKNRVASEADKRSSYWRVYYKEKARERHFIRKYGITVERREEILKQQKKRCAICRREEIASARSFVIDHCHKTGAVRGLLCHLCNQALGALSEDTTRMLRAISYLSGGGVGAELTAHGR